MPIAHFATPIQPTPQAYGLGSILATGAEGVVYQCSTHPEYVVKLFTGTPHEVLAKADRIQAMLKMRALRFNQQIAWPCLPYMRAGRIVGYLMPYYRDTVNLVSLSAEVSRRHYLPDWTNLHTALVAHRISSLSARLENESIFIVDTSLTNFLTNPRNAETYLIDTDSLQITTSDRHFASTVYTPEFAAPEILEQPDRLGRIGTEQARFTIAMLLFRLYTQGSPYQVADRENLSPEQQILKGRHFLGAKGVATGHTTDAIYQRYRQLSPCIMMLFKRAFIDGHRCPDARPTFHEWARATAAYYNEMNSHRSSQ